MTHLRPGPHLTGPEPDHSYLGTQPPSQTRRNLARSCPVYRPDGPTARIPACHTRVRFRQTHPCKFTPSPAPLPTDGPTRTSIPKIHLRAAPPSTGTRQVEGKRPTRPSAQRPGPGPLTNPTTRQRPHARLRLGCAPPRGPPSGTATRTGANIKRVAYDPSTSDSFPRGSSNSHYLRAGPALNRRPPATSLAYPSDCSEDSD